MSEKREEMFFTTRPLWYYMGLLPAFWYFYLQPPVPLDHRFLSALKICQRWLCCHLQSLQRRGFTVIHCCSSLTLASQITCLQLGLGNNSFISLWF